MTRVTLVRHATVVGDVLKHCYITACVKMTLKCVMYVCVLGLVCVVCVREWDVCVWVRYVCVSEVCVCEWDVCVCLRYVWVSEVCVSEWGVCVLVRYVWLSEVCVCEWGMCVCEWGMCVYVFNVCVWQLLVRLCMCLMCVSGSYWWACVCV